MKRSRRIAFELLGPAFIAVFLYLSLLFIVSRDLIVVKGFFMFLVFGYVLSAIPSVVFTVLMEFAFARGLEGRSWRAVALASGLGALSGVAIALTFARGFDNGRGSFTLFPVLGFITGAIVGLMIFVFSKKGPNQALQHNDPSCHAPCVRTCRASRGRG